MRTFNYREEADRLISHRSVSQIGTLHEFMGEKRIIQQTSPETLENMNEVAALHTVASAARNSGFNLIFETVMELVNHSVTPQNEAEQSVVRYARALSSVVHDEYNHENMMEDIIRLYSLLFYDDPNSSQSPWRVHNMPYKRATENETYSHELPPHEDAESLFRAICEEYSAVIAEGEIHPFYIIPVFFTDFVAIQPFDRAYYETIRLILAYLLHWAGYTALETICAEQCLEEVEDGPGLLISSLIGWHEGTNNYHRSFDLCIEISKATYRMFTEWVKLMLDESTKTQDIVMKIIQLQGRTMTKKKIMEYAPYVKESSIELALYSLKKAGLITKVGGGRYSEYAYSGPEGDKN